MKKKIIIILSVILLLTVLIGIGTYYLNTYYLPQIVKAKITEEASKQLGALIEIGDIKLSLFKGIVIHNFNIRDKKDSSSILHTDRLSVSFLIFPFLKERKIIFPYIGIDGASINIIRYENNSLNIQNLIPKQVAANNKNAAKKSSPPLIIYKMGVNNSSVFFLDKAVSPNMKHTLKLNYARAQLSASAANFSLQGALANETQSANVKLSGSFQFKNKELKISSQIDKFDAAAYAAYLKDLPLQIKSLTLSQINTEAALLDNKVSGKTTLDLKDASLTKEKSGISNASAKINASFDVDLKNLSALNYIVDIDGLNAAISDPQIPQGTSIENASLQISPNSADIKQLKIKALNTSADIKGKLENFLDPVFSFNVQSSVDITTAKEFLKNYISIDDSISADGKADINVDVAKTKDKKDLSFKGSLNLTDASLKAKGTPYEIKAVNGLIDFDEKKASWSDLSFNFMDNSFKSKAEITNFTSPSVNIELDSDKIDISAKINSAQQNNFNIEYLKGVFYNSKLDLSGSLSIKGQNNIYADLKIQSQVELGDLLQMPYLPTKDISQINPQGLLKIDANVKGNLKDVKSLSGAVNLASDELKFYGLSLKEIALSLAEENQQLKISNSTAKFYDGTISINGIAELNEENNPFIMNISLQDTDLSLLKSDTPMKDKELEGILTAVVDLNGQIDANPLASLKGKGQFLIKDGYLWEFSPLKKLGDFLFIPSYETLVFKKASADFTIADQKVSTDNLTLDSNIISLACEGTIDFAGNLNFEIAPYPKQEETQKSEEEETQESEETAIDSLNNKINDRMVKLAGVSIIQVTGTIQNPKVGMKMVTKEVVDKLKEGVKGTVDTVKDVFGMIFGGNQE